MRIKRISEKFVEDISNDKVEEILSQLKKISADFFQGKENLEKIHTDLEKFSNKKTKNNDQIDDSVLNLEKNVNSISEILESIDIISESLKDYIDNGRKYIY